MFIFGVQPGKHVGEAVQRVNHHESTTGPQVSIRKKTVYNTLPVTTRFGHIFAHCLGLNHVESTFFMFKSCLSDFPGGYMSSCLTDVCSSRFAQQPACQPVHTRHGLPSSSHGCGKWAQL